MEKNLDILGGVISLAVGLGLVKGQAKRGVSRRWNGHHYRQRHLRGRPSAQSITLETVSHAGRRHDVQRCN